MKGWLPKKSIKGWHAYVTGGGNGIGREMSIMLAEYGANVTIIDINQKGAEETAEMIREAGGRALAIKTDVTNPDDIKHSAEICEAEFGPVDLLMNNAGIVSG